MKQARNELIKKRHNLSQELETCDTVDLKAKAHYCLLKIAKIDYTLDIFDEIERRDIGKPNEDDTRIQLVIKQYEELMNRFDVAMKALELIVDRYHTFGDSANLELVAEDAITKIEAMHKDYDDKNELRK